MAGYSYQSFHRTSYAINTDVAHTPSHTVTDTIDNRSELVILSLFGRFNYTYNDRYMFTFTLRNDNTSRFSPADQNRSGWFPSVALAWKIDKESFLSESKVISQLKLRLGWGITGQQDIGDNYYPYLPRYTYSQANASYRLGNIYYITLGPEGYNAGIKWEETTTWNAGLDFGFAEDRYYGSVDVYYRKTKDLLNIIPVAAGTNLTNF
jgi:iron complex outermembrane receptor protein